MLFKEVLCDEDDSLLFFEFDLLGFLSIFFFKSTSFSVVKSEVVGSSTCFSSVLCSEQRKVPGFEVSSWRSKI